MSFFVSLLLTIMAAGAAVSFDLLQEEWNTFKLKHGKRYDLNEDEYRKSIFLNNRHRIEKHNQRYLNNLTTFYVGTNKFSDYYDSEVNAYLFGFNITDYLLHSKRGATFMPPVHADIPDSINWIRKGAVTNIKDQKTCACCWAFAATGALEGQVFRKSKRLVSLSEQNLLDCNSRGEGCTSSSHMLAAFDYVARNQGIDTENSYPYKATKQQCRFNTNTIGARSAGFTTIQNGEEEMLKIAVATQGPVAVGIHASLDTFRDYKGGIYYDDRCNAQDLNHAMLVVGYGSYKGNEYWLLKNSWGDNWGMKGYMWLARDKENHCGVATAVSYPLLSNDMYFFV